MTTSLAVLREFIDLSFNSDKYSPLVMIVYKKFSFATKSHNSGKSVLNKGSPPKISSLVIPRVLKCLILFFNMSNVGCAVGISAL